MSKYDSASRRFFCELYPPMRPTEWLMIPAGRFFQATSLLGLEPMSMAFFRQAGMVRLFSGVTNNTPSEALMISRNWVYSDGVGLSVTSGSS